MVQDSPVDVQSTEAIKFFLPAVFTSMELLAQSIVLRIVSGPEHAITFTWHVWMLLPPGYSLFPNPYSDADLVQVNSILHSDSGKSF